MFFSNPVSLSYLLCSNLLKDLVKQQLSTLSPWSTPLQWTCQWWMETRWRTSGPSFHPGWPLHLSPAPRTVGYTRTSRRQPIRPCGWTGPRPWPPRLCTMATCTSNRHLAANGGETKAKRGNVIKDQEGANQTQHTRSVTTSAKPETWELTDSRRKSPLSPTSPCLPAGHPLRAPAGLT